MAEREVEPRAVGIQRYAFNHGVVPVAVGEEVALSLERLYGIQQCRVIRNVFQWIAMLVRRPHGANGGRGRLPGQRCSVCLRARIAPRRTTRCS